MRCPPSCRPRCACCTLEATFQPYLSTLRQQTPACSLPVQVHIEQMQCSSRNILHVMAAIMTIFSSAS